MTITVGCPQTNRKTDTGKTLKPWPVLVDHYTTSKIISHALTLTDKEFKELLLKPYAGVIWISIENALFQRWENKDERTIWHKVFISVLNNIVCASDAEQERYTLNDALKS